jgi:hypothetical protein
MRQYSGLPQLAAVRMKAARRTSEPPVPEAPHKSHAGPGCATKFGSTFSTHRIRDTNNANFVQYVCVNLTRSRLDVRDVVRVGLPVGLALVDLQGDS